MNTLIKRLLSLFSPREAEPTLSGSQNWVNGYDSHTVELEGGARFDLVYETGTNDPIVTEYLRGHRFNQFLTDMLARFTQVGDCVLDLGAHVGTFALTAAALGRRVIAVDASPKHFDLLNQSVERNGFDQMTVVHTAVGERTGIVRFHLAGVWGAIAQPGQERPEVRDMPVVEVPLIPGDRLLKRLGQSRVDFIKMDIEGSEIAAVRGLKSLLKRDNAPVIYYECNSLTLNEFGFKAGGGELRKALEDFGYRSYRVEGSRFSHFPSDAFQPELYVDLIAMKPRHELIVGSAIDPAPGMEKLIEMSLKESRVNHHAYRANLARVLANAPRAILDDDRIQGVLETLSSDPAEQVRQASSWWTHRQADAA